MNYLYIALQISGAFQVAVDEPPASHEAPHQLSEQGDTYLALKIEADEGWGRKGMRNKFRLCKIIRNNELVIVC